MADMTFGELLDEMRARLTSRGTSMDPEDRLVKMGCYRNAGYKLEETVQMAIECFAKRSISAFALGEKLNPLEQLGAELLLDSAYLYDELKAK